MNRLTNCGTLPFLAPSPPEPCSCSLPGLNKNSTSASAHIFTTNSTQPAGRAQTVHQSEPRTTSFCIDFAITCTEGSSGQVHKSKPVRKYCHPPYDNARVKNMCNERDLSPSNHGGTTTRKHETARGTFHRESHSSELCSLN